MNPTSQKKVDTTQIEALLESYDSTIGRDLKLNLKRLLEEGSLAPGEALLVLLATATSVGHPGLAAVARAQLPSFDYSPEQIREAAESAALMGMLNVYYRFRHMVGPDRAEDYKQAGLRMTALARPALGKKTFEMLAFAVSVLNGCENCIRAHEETLRKEGATVNQIHDLARIAAITKGIRSLEP